MTSRTFTKTDRKWRSIWLYPDDDQTLVDAKNECDVSMADLLRLCIAYGFDDAVAELKQQKKARKRTLFLGRGGSK